MKSCLENGIREMNIECSNKQAEILLEFTEELMLWNKKTGFVKADGTDLVTRHVLDSLSGVNILKTMVFTSIADAGTGAGFPGIPLSVFFPDKKFLLIERSEKKCSFLYNCKAIFSLDNIEIFQGNAEEVADKFDIVTFRAFRKLNEYNSILNSLLMPEGSLFAYKGKLSEIESEIRELDIKNYQLVKVNIPGMTEERHILIIKKQ